MPDAVVALRNDLEKMKEQFQFALPAHIPPARFIRVVMTAVQNNPKLLKCSRTSLFNACMKCAQDGLLPDGHEAALVPFGDDPDSGQSKADIAQYIPMIAGIRKKVRNAKILTDWNVQVVQQGDAFDYQLGDDPFIAHKPSPTGGRTRPVLFAYSIATYPDGTKSREVMNADQIRDVQSKAKAKRGPWSDPIFYPEMCRKTVAKLHAKQLPMSTDLDTVLRRDDELYDFKGERERAQRASDAKPPPSVGAALDIFGADPQQDEPAQPAQDLTREPAPPPADQQQLATAEGGRKPEGESGGQQDDRAQPAAAAPPPPASPPPADDPIAAARRQGYEARTLNIARKAIPGELRAPERSREAQAWQTGWDNANNADKGGGTGPGGTALLVLATVTILAMSFAPAFAEHHHHHHHHGKPIPNAVATIGVKPTTKLRPPSPTASALMPRVVSGSPISTGRDALAFAGKAAPKPEPIAFSDRWTSNPPEAVAIPAVYVTTEPPAPPPRLVATTDPDTPLAFALATVLAGLVLAVRPSLREVRRRRDARWRRPLILDLNRGVWI
jgi:recombination protein RecT